MGAMLALTETLHSSLIAVAAIPPSRHADVKVFAIRTITMEDGAAIVIICQE